MEVLQYLTMAATWAVDGDRVGLYGSGGWTHSGVKSCVMSKRLLVLI
jgi:hypothetical protein